MSNLSAQIEKGAKQAGNQQTFAARVGVPATHLSGFKNGRPCSARTRVLIANETDDDIATATLEGLYETATRTGDTAYATALRKALHRIHGLIDSLFSGRSKKRAKHRTLRLGT